MPNSKMYKLGQRITIEITRHESGFDRACDSAYDSALMAFGCDEDGHINNVTGSDRSSHGIFVELVGYVHSGGMGGHTHVYEFQAYVAAEAAELRGCSLVEAPANA